MIDAAVASAPSLRERKRTQTWISIHEIAAEAALRCDCLAEITVDEIAGRAGVSTRTFFNYFASKEDAVLGLKNPTVDDDLAASFTIGPADDPLEKVAALIYAVDSVAVGVRNRDRRLALMRRHPDLARRRIEHVETIKDLVRAVVARGLATSPRWLAAERDHTVDEAAEILVDAAHSVLRIVVRSQLDTTTDTTADGDDIVRAARRFRSVIEEI